MKSKKKFSYFSFNAKNGYPIAVYSARSKKDAIRVSRLPAPDFPEEELSGCSIHKLRKGTVIDAFTVIDGYRTLHDVTV